MSGVGIQHHYYVSNVIQFLTKLICWQNRVQMKQQKPCCLVLVCSKDCWENRINFRKDCALPFVLHHEVNDMVNWGQVGESGERVCWLLLQTPQMLVGKVSFPFPVRVCVCVWECSCVYTRACGVCARMHMEARSHCHVSSSGAFCLI